MFGSERIFWVSELILRVSGSGRVGRVERAAGSGEFNVCLGILNAGYFYKRNTRGEKCCILVCCTRRDLSHETDLPKEANLPQGAHVVGRKFSRPKTKVTSCQ